MSGTVHEARWRDAPGWDRLEAGLDTAFKALGARAVLIALAAVTWMAPPAEGSAELFGGVRVALDLITLGVTVWLALALLRSRSAPHDTAARPALLAALVAVSLALAAEATLAADGFVTILPGPRAAATVRLLDHALLLGALALLLAATARAALRAQARDLLPWFTAGQVAVAVFTASYAALFFSDALREASAWRALLAALAAGAAFFALYPLHRLARRLTQAAAVPVVLQDLDLNAPYAEVRVAERLPNRALSRYAADDDVDGWRSRGARVAHLRLLGVSAPGLPDRPRWVAARDGLRLYFGAFLGRVAASLLAFVVPINALGGGALTLFVGFALLIGLATGSGAAALGLWRFAQIPRRSGARGVALTTAALAAALFAGDLLLLALLAVTAAWGPVPALADAVGLVTGALALVGPLVLTYGLGQLGHVLGDADLPRGARRVFMLAPLLVTMMVGRELLLRQGGPDAQGATMMLGFALVLLGLVVVVQLLHLLHDGAEALDDHIARAERLTDDGT